MGSGHGKARAAVILLALAVSLSTTQLARAAAPRVVCIDPGDRELQARIEGQTRDLPLQLIWRARTGRVAPSALELARIAREQSASFVVLLQPSAAGGMNVHVYDAAHRQLRTRVVPAPRSAERLGASTVAETTALIIRGELNAALAALAEAAAAPREPAPATGSAGTPSNGTVQGASSAIQSAPGTSPVSPAAQPGNRSESPAPAKPAEAAEPRSEPEPPEAEDEPDPGLTGTSARPERALSLAVGARLSAPGAALALGGVWLGARLELDGFELGLGASTTLPGHLENDAVRVTLRRHAIGADLLALVSFGYDLELWLGVSAGVVLHARQTRALDALHETTPDHTTFGAVFAPLAELRWRFTYNLGVSVRIGLDLLPSAPRFTYESAAAQRAELAKLAALEPFVLLSLFASTWR